MASDSFIVMVSLLLALFLLTLCSAQDEIRELPECPPNVYNPTNTITINSCCNETSSNDEIQQELQAIKDLLNTITTSLENGDYCCDTARESRDCYEVQQRGQTTSGIYTIQPVGSEPFSVYCDMDTDGGGWTVFQRRQDGSVDFYLDWQSYKSGFGPLPGEHWLGNEKLYYLSNQDTYKLRVDLEDFEDNVRYAVYDSFVISDESDKYRLTLGSYSGDAEDAMTYHSGQQFSTRDQDNDVYDGQCAERFKGGWWYQKCHYANPNGLYLSGSHESYADGIEWFQWRGYHYSLKFTELKLKPV